jgi:hypothetical protein
MQCNEKLNNHDKTQRDKKMTPMAFKTNALSFISQPVCPSAGLRSIFTSKKTPVCKEHTVSLLLDPGLGVGSVPRHFPL